MKTGQSLQDLLACLLRDEPVLFPTDTVPALGIRPDAAQDIWSLKRRPAHKPLILMGADRIQLEQALAIPWLPEWVEEAERVWPGPVTLVLPATGLLQQALNPGGESLGVRVPACAMALEMLRHSGPLATTSVNRSGDPPALTAHQAHLLFPELPLLAPLPWPEGSGIPSEVKAWQQGSWRVLRSQRPSKQ